jgi:hypothetical protein
MTIIKTDTLGLGRTSPEQRDALLSAFDRSGMSGAAFARLHGIRYSTFAHWRQTRKQQRKSAEDSPTAIFEEIEVRRSEINAADLKIDLPR